MAKYDFRELIADDSEAAWQQAEGEQVKAGEVVRARKKIATLLGNWAKRVGENKTLPRKVYERAGDQARLTVLHGDTVVQIDDQPYLVFPIGSTAKVLESLKTFVEAGEADAAIKEALSAPEPIGPEPKKRGRGRPRKSQ